MERQNAIVDRIRQVARLPAPRAAEAPGPAENYLEVRFESGGSGLLDMRFHRDAVWADVLRSLQERNQPAYVEIDPETHRVTELLLPRRFTVGRIESYENGVEVELIISHGRHVVRESNPRFSELREKLEAARDRNAPVLVAETDEHEIVDVRALDESAEASE
jgi:hypothetical protein